MSIRTLVISSFFALFSLTYSSLSLADKFKSCAEQNYMLVSDCEVLVTLYNETNGRSWSSNWGWLVYDNPCDWPRVSCYSEQPFSPVLRLSLSNNFVSGQIPDALGQLSAIKELYLGGNSLSGPIPSSLGSLAKLTNLDLSGNRLTGTIPSSFGNLVQLTTLKLQLNLLTGQIPNSLGNLVNLQGTLDLSGNVFTRFSGELPDSLGNLINLTSLDLSNNKLSG